ncbi:hypothetical protein OJF2_18940 [Aquisphaera giovannonii]|uniref:DUF4058 domain-containing protein n=1 Tax=Aquisphaera giovannonii TaxID=406548 RepID=A0A5B9VYH1_9BACT|nr:DUF4058 family protein [Aquisphaera giovannonii]QEH33393.1 hypothetical protein OJF2_18940 [Aquisphaera giovannonii]
MPSPFPGMNPWLEQEDSWPDFHTKFLVALNEQLVPSLAGGYYVVLERYIYVHEPERKVQRSRASLVVAHPGEGSGGGREPGVGLLEAPSEIGHTLEETEEVPYLAIRRASVGELVTVLEMLSPSNKQGKDRRQYLDRRNQILASHTHLVEIDLLRGGEPMPDEDRPPCDYSVMVSRREHRPRAGFWPIGLRDRLPEIPIPLRSPDGDARVDLGAALHQVYDRSGYETFLYRGRPSPPLRPADEEWARGLVPPSRA